MIHTEPLILPLILLSQWNRSP